MQTQIRDMTKGHPIPLILRLALPLMAGNAFQQMYTVVDTAIVGKFLGISALSAVGAGDWYGWLFIGVVVGLAQGFSIDMAHAFGAGDMRELRRDVGHSITLSAILGMLLTAAALLSTAPALRFLGTPEEILPDATLYLLLRFAGIPIMMAYNLAACILRTLGDGKNPLISIIVASLLNVGLDLLLVVVIPWGIAGAAIATLLAQLFSFLYLLAVLKKLKVVHPEKGDLRPIPEKAKRLLALGMPMALQNLIIAAGGLIVQKVVNGFGMIFLAGYTATNKFYGLLEIAATGYGYSMTTYAGQNHGARKPERIRRGIWMAVITAVLTSALIAAFAIVFGRDLLSLFVSGNSADVTETLNIGYEFLFLMSVFLPVLYVLHVVRSTVQGLGDTVMPMISGFVELVLRVGAALLLPAVMGYAAVFWAETLAWVGAALLLVFSYFRDIRRLYPAHQ